MAFALNFLDPNDYVSIPALPVMSNFDIIIEFKNTGNIQTIIGSDTPSLPEDNNAHFRIGVSSTGRVLVLNGTETIESTSPVNQGDVRNVMYSVRNHSGGFSGTAELFLEGVKEGVTTSFRGACLANSTISLIGRSVSSNEGVRNFIGGELRRLQVIDYDTPENSRDYLKQTLVGSDDTAYTEQENGNYGTLVNFPTDNSQWVFYEDGGSTDVTADAAFTISVPSVSASATVTFPQSESNIDFTVSAPGVSASASASVPQPVSDIAFSVNTPSVSASTSATIPGYNATVSFTVNTPSVAADASATLPSPVANVAYTINAPSISANTSASIPRPSSDIAFTVNAPSVSVAAEATQTGYNADVAFSVNAPTASISVSATLPQPDLAVSFAVSPPQVSVVAIVGGIAIIVDEETNINQRALSTNINAPILSNNING